MLLSVSRPSGLLLMAWAMSAAYDSGGLTCPPAGASETESSSEPWLPDADPASSRRPVLRPPDRGWAGGDADADDAGLLRSRARGAWGPPDRMPPHSRSRREPDSQHRAVRRE